MALGYQGFVDAPVDVQTRVFIESANEVFAKLDKELSQNAAAGVETVLSSEKYRKLVEGVVARQGFVGLIYIALSSPAIAMERVAARVKGGGHGIPDDKIAQRWQRSLDQLGWFAANATAFWVFDNSDSQPVNPPPRIASGKFGILEFLDGAAFREMKAALRGLPAK